MMNQNKTDQFSSQALIGIAAVLIIASLAIVYVWKGKGSGETPVVAACGSEEQTKWDDKHVTVKGAMMGESVGFIRGYYDCNPVRVGDLVLYRYAQSKEPIFRRVRASAGDQFESVFDDKVKQWNLLVNGDLVKLDDGHPFVYGSEPAPPLKLYEKDRKESGLREDELIVSVDHGSAYLDSGMFGVISKQDLLGKVVEP